MFDDTDGFCSRLIGVSRGWARADFVPHREDGSAGRNHARSGSSENSRAPWRQS